MELLRKHTRNWAMACAADTDRRLALWVSKHGKLPEVRLIPLRMTASDNKRIQKATDAGWHVECPHHVHHPQVYPDWMASKEFEKSVVVVFAVSTTQLLKQCKATDKYKEYK